MSTYRERRLAKADRLESWAEAREARQPALSEAARTDEAATGIPFGQPILVGHHSERRHRRTIERVDRAMAASVENSAKAASMASRAESIRAAADRAIYDDDPDAVERLTVKLEQLEAKRDRIKRYNASARKTADGQPGDLSILTAHEQREIMQAMARDWQEKVRRQGVFPSYVLQNLGGVITTTRQRIVRLSRPVEAERGRPLTARYASECRKCGATVERGARVLYFKRAKAIECETCATP